MNTSLLRSMNEEDEASRRFGGLQRLYGVDGAQRIRQAHVVLAGIGGSGLLGG